MRKRDVDIYISEARSLGVEITQAMQAHLRADSPICVYVGDTLFVGDMGRPDIFLDMANELAEKLYNSLHNKLLKLSDYVEVYPAQFKKTVLICSSGNRSSLGASILKQHGFKDIINVAGIGIGILVGA